MPLTIIKFDFNIFENIASLIYIKPSKRIQRLRGKPYGVK